MKLSEIRERLRFWKETDRLGRDIPLTHRRLHFKSSKRALCKSKFIPDRVVAPGCPAKVIRQIGSAGRGP